MDAFVMYRNYCDAIRNLPTAEDQATAFLAVCDYMLDGVEPELDGMAAVFFSFVKPSLDKNIQRAMNGRKGGRPKTKQTASKNKPDNNQNEPTENRNKTETKPKHNQNVTISKPNQNQNETELEPTENQTETKTKPNKIINNKVINNKIINNEYKQPEATASSCSPKRQQAVTFGYDTDAKIHGITPELIAYWKEQFPAVDIEQEIRSAEAWLDSNRTKRKHDIKRFLTSWLTRTQEKASARATTPQNSTYQQNRRNYSGFDGNIHPEVSAEDREAYNGF